jgi:predicted lipid-binding transport protein (Tim44 family)
MSKTFFRMSVIASAIVLAGAIAADARPGGGRSSGSRGSQTHSAPPPTATAPNTAQPMQRTTAPTPAPGMQQPGMAQRPGMTPPAQQGSRWGGLGMGLAAGFLGAGLFGLMSGQGMLGGLGSMSGMFGFLLQLALIGGLVYLVYRLVRGRREAALGPQPAHARMGAGPMGGAPNGIGGNGPIPGMAGGGGAPRQAPQAITVDPQDFDQFERLLTDVNEAFSREDMNALRAITTAEMAGYFADDLRDNAAKGVVSRISNVKLLQGDLSEAWREQDADYATVAMRFGLVDVTINRASGQIVGGNPRGEEVTELWTFRRPHGGAWQLSAIQQA